METQFDVDRIRATGQRYVQRVVDLPDGLEAIAAAKRPDQRKERLSRQLTQDKTRALIFEAEAQGAGRDPGITLASLAHERIIGTSDLMDIKYLEMAVAVGRAVCRIRIGSGFASGVLVGPRVLMTNNHVIGASDDARHARAQFDYQQNLSGDMLPVQEFVLDADLFFHTDPTLDFTLVGTAPKSTRGKPIDGYPWLQLIGQLGKADTGDPVNIIQHPRGGLKQIAIRNNTIIEIPDGKRDFLYYTTDTEPGSSGSPCFNDQWEMVALHHSGVPAMRNGDILKKDGTPWRHGQDDYSLIEWVANEGGRISAIVDSLRAADLSDHEDELRARLLNDRPPNPIEAARSSSRGDAKPDPGSHVVAPFSSGGGATVSFTMPLNFSVTLGAPRPVEPDQKDDGPATVRDTSAVSDLAVDDLSLLEAVVIDPDWSARKGYVEDFLGINIPLPALSSAMQAQTALVPANYRGDHGKYVLDYHHYSVAMNKDRGFAWYSAAIIDGDRRFKLPKRDDKWFIDPRIDDPDDYVIQCGEELYATAKTDRGHLTRYLDVAWGNTKAEAIKAVNDTFHFTNCCLQLEGFNRSKNRWQGIEQFLLENKAKKEKRRMVLITGPLFTDDDPYYQNEHMDYTVPIPLEFWKVCALIRDNDDTLAATAFVLGQKDVANLPGFEEVFDVMAAQVTLQELEQRTGLKFGVLTNSDHFAEGGAPGTLEIDMPGGGKRRVKPLRSLADIVV